MRNAVTIRNRTGDDLARLSLAVGGERFDLGPLAAGAMESVSFVPTADASLTLCVDRGDGETCADDGYVTRNLLQTHRLDLLPDQVRYSAR